MQAESMARQLCPVQQQAVDVLVKKLEWGSVFELRGKSGVGKSTILRHLHQQLGGVFLQMTDFIDAMQGQHPLALEETCDRLLTTAIRAHDIVIMDDLQLICQIFFNGHSYPRAGLFNLPLLKLCTYAAAANKRVICANGPFTYLYPPTITIAIDEFDAADYASLCCQFLGAKAERLDYRQIYRFAAHLNAYQIRTAGLELSDQADLDTEQFIDYLRSRQLASNVNLGEVQAVDFADLKGIDDILESLEANLIVPLEHDELAQELNLKPKRGVLLAGPPGTGKTTIGRALAHRLKSKFFLIDGTFIAGMGDFFEKVNAVFAAAKQNAPAIVFIDDSDVIFEGGGEHGLYRYLLTLLDGLESEAIGQVCVMMTAMNVNSLPPALVRSGRIELWLETRLPNAAARAEILADRLSSLPTVLAQADVAQLVPPTEGFTGADLKRLIEEGKTLYAHDKVRGLALRSPTDYYLAAVEIVMANKTRYAEAEAHARQHPAAHANGQLSFDAIQAMALHQAVVGRLEGGLGGGLEGNFGDMPF